VTRDQDAVPVLPVRSLIIPMYNEVERIGATLDTLLRSALNRPELEIVLVDDGSTDRSAEVTEKLIAEAGAYNASVLGFDQNRGKGAAVRHGMLSSRGSTRVYVDADLSVTVDDIEQCFARIERGDADVVYATRAHVDTDLREKQPAHRVASGRVFNLLLRALGLTAERDTQCGLKGFSAAAAVTLFGALRTERFAFDVEILARAQRAAISTASMPVTWNHTGGSRVRLRDGFDVARAVIAIRRAVGPVAK
jgi:dolichyl-phosphate beta-glucosyltransferase